MKMNILGIVLGLGLLESSSRVFASSSTDIDTTTNSVTSPSADTSMSTSTSTDTSILSTSSTYISSSSSMSLLPRPSSDVTLPKKKYNIAIERPKMINRINIQRSGMSHPLLCQDSLLTSIAQQHANDMAALDDLEHDLPCSSDAFPVQFCKSADRLGPYGQASENILSLAGNDGSAKTAMAQFNSDAAKFSNMMNKDYLYVGVGMAMNAVSGKYYWVQVFSDGNFQGVSCTLTPSVSVLDAFNRTTTTVQPIAGLNQGLYPRGITANNNVDKKNGNKKLYCTMIPFAKTSSVPLGQVPYPTITMVPMNVSSIMNYKVSGIIGAFQAALSQANASIIGPSSISLLPMQVIPTDSVSVSDSETSSTSMPTATDAGTDTIGSSMTVTVSGSISVIPAVPTINPASMISSLTPTNSAQSSALLAMSSLISDPQMSSAMAQMASFMMMATSTS